MSIQAIAVIRDRGQLTIPEKIRKQRKWVTHTSVVTISSENPDEIVIKPYPSKQVDWDKLWKQLKRVRSFKGKGKGSLSDFIAEDRYRH